MLTKKQEKIQVNSRLNRQLLLDASNEIHSRIRPDVSDFILKDFMSIPYLDIFNEIVIRENYDFESEGEMSNILSSSSRPGVIWNNIAKSVSLEYKTYKSIVASMRQSVLDLDLAISSSKAYSEALPTLTTTKMNDYIRQYHRNHSDNLPIIPNNQKVVQPTELLKILGLSPENIKQSLIEADAFLKVEASKIINDMSVSRIMSVITNKLGNYSPRTVASFEDLSVMCMFNSLLAKDVPDVHDYIISINRTLYTMVGLSENEDILVYGTSMVDQNILVNTDNYVKVIDGQLGNSLLGWSINNPKQTCKLSALTSNSSENLSIYESTMTRIQVKNDTERSSKIRHWVRNIKTELIDDLPNDLIKRLSGDDYSNKGLIQLTGMSTGDLKSTKRIVENLYLNILFKTSMFPKFYKFAEGSSVTNVQGKISTGMYSIIVLILLGK